MLLTLILNLGMAAGAVEVIEQPSINVGGRKKPRVMTVSGKDYTKARKEDKELLKIVGEILNIL